MRNGTKIVLFYHCLFGLEDENGMFEERPGAFWIVHEFISCLRQSGFLDAVDEFVVGINGGPESSDYARLVIPPQAKTIYHGLKSRAENLTIIEIEKWLKTNSHQNTVIFYAHAKGATHDPTHPYTEFATRWRKCMLGRLIMNWRQAVDDLNSGAEAVGCHWLTGMADGSQNIFAGNYWAARASYLATLPSMYARERISLSGIAAKESRYEAEVWIGNGPRLPIVRDYHPGPPCNG